MLKLVLLCVVLYFIHGQHVVIVNSDTSTTIVSPASSTTTESPYFNKNQGSLVPGAYWIWNSAGDSSEKGTTLVFNKNFYLTCAGPLTLTIAAFGSYSVWWDYTNVLNGTNYLSATQISLKSYCGNHNLTVVVTKTSTASYSGLVYSVSQDQSQCYKCTSNSFWSEYTCSCKCLTNCACPSNKRWADYPTCACVCPPRIIIPWPRPPLPIPIPPKIPPIPLETPAKTEPAATQAAIRAKPIIADLKPQLNLKSDLLVRFWFCPLNEYYHSQTCSCRCHYQYCPPGYYFNDDPSIYGGCRCIYLIK